MKEIIVCDASDDGNRLGYRIFFLLLVVLVPASVCIPPIGGITPTERPPTVSASPTINKPPTLPLNTYDAEFDKHVTLPDNKDYAFPVSPGEELVKIWRLNNTGSTAWGNGYQLVFLDGAPLSAPTTVDLPPVAPGEKVGLCVRLRAPNEGGIYRGNWNLRNPQGILFGDRIWFNIQVCTEPFPARHDGFDCQEKYLLDLINDYRGEQYQLDYDNGLQQEAESCARQVQCNTPACHCTRNEVMADMSGDQQENRDGAYNALYCPSGCEEKDVLEKKCFCWSKSPDHNRIISDHSFTRIGIGHASTVEKERFSNDWAWIAQFDKSETPTLILDGDVVVESNPVIPQQEIHFTFSIRNANPTEQHITKIFVLTISPNGNEWKASADPVNIPPKETVDFSASAPASDETGVWQVKEISFEVNEGSWFSITNPHCRLLNPTFTVVMPQTEPTLTSTFDNTDVDGWRLHLGSITNPGSGGSGGGANNGFLETSPPGDSRTSYYIAPTKYHGDWRNYSQLRLDLWSSGGNYYGSGYDMYGGDIYLVNGQMTAKCLLSHRPTDTWETFNIPLDNTSCNWQFGGGATSLADVLANVTDFQIRAEYGVGRDTSGLDNVELK